MKQWSPANDVFKRSPVQLVTRQDVAYLELYCGSMEMGYSGRIPRVDGAGFVRKGTWNIASWEEAGPRRKGRGSNLGRFLQLFLTLAKFLFVVYCCDRNVGNTAHCRTV